MAALRGSGEDKILAMTVDNLGFLLDRLGQDCHPLQFLRELTQNSIEAILRQGSSGDLVWDVEWTKFDLEGVRKLCLLDTGDGMSGEEMVRFINQLSSSVSKQSMSGNYGVGAKIAAATRNPAGVLYLSWKAGQGAMIHLFKDSATGQYGLKQWMHADGSYAHYLPIENDLRPAQIKDHGTMVVLLGSADAEDTLRAPASAPSPSRWVSKYLNTRYFRFPKSVTIRAREGWENPKSDVNRNVLRTLTGQETYLSEHAVESGSLPLKGATARWWILKDEEAIKNNSGFIESAGHVAALYNDELYELTTARAGMSRLQQFGITFGYKFVVIYVEPLPAAGQHLTTNTARTSLLVDNEQLPWSDWAEEFRENLPKPLKRLVEEKAAAAADTDHSKSIRDRLKEILSLYRVSRYRPGPSGDVMIDPEMMVRGGKTGTNSKGGKGGGGRSGDVGGTAGNVYALFERKDGVPGRKLEPDPFPKVNWVSRTDGTREYGDIEDRAAKYLADQNTLLINADFRVFDDVVGFFKKELGDAPGFAELAREAVRGWYEQALVETVIGVQALRNSREWTFDDIERALSEEALTGAVMQRYHVLFAVKRELGSKLGSLKAQAAS